MLNGYGIKVRYDVIKKKLIIIIPGLAGTTDNMDIASMSYIMSLCALHGMPTFQIPAYILTLADKNPYNPVADMITSKPWDGKDRLRAICDTVTAHEDFPEVLKVIPELSELS